MSSREYFSQVYNEENSSHHGLLGMKKKNTFLQRLMDGIRSQPRGVPDKKDIGSTKNDFSSAEKSGHLSSFSSSLRKPKQTGHMVKKDKKKVRISSVSTLLLYPQCGNKEDLYLTELDEMKAGKSAMKTACQIQEALEEERDGKGGEAPRDYVVNFLTLALALNRNNTSLAEEMVGLERLACGCKHVLEVEAERRDIVQSVVSMWKLWSHDPRNLKLRDVGHRKEEAAERIALFAQTMTRKAASTALRRAAYVRWLNEHTSSLDGAMSLSSVPAKHVVPCFHAAKAA